MPLAAYLARVLESLPEIKNSILTGLSPVGLPHCRRKLASRWDPEGEGEGNCSQVELRRAPKTVLKYCREDGGGLVGETASPGTLCLLLLLWETLSCLQLRRGQFTALQQLNRFMMRKQNLYGWLKKTGLIVFRHHVGFQAYQCECKKKKKRVGGSNRDLTNMSLYLTKA